MNQPQKNNPLHRITLEQVVTQLADHYGWEKMGEKIKRPLGFMNITKG